MFCILSLLTIFLRDLLGYQILQNAMDALADPDNVNQFIILWLDENEILPHSPNLATDQYVPLLQNFTKHSPSKPSDMVRKYRCIKFSLNILKQW